MQKSAGEEDFPASRRICRSLFPGGEKLPLHPFHSQALYRGAEALSGEAFPLEEENGFLDEIQRLRFKYFTKELF